MQGTPCIVANNTCNGNTEDGIHIQSSSGVIVEDNTCYSNVWGIYLGHSDIITLFNNTCNYNRIGIHIQRSHVDTVTHNTCNNNSIGIFLYYSTFESWENNAYVGNIEHDTIEEFETKIPPQPTTPPSPETTTSINEVDMTIMLLVGVLLLPSSIIVFGSRWRIAFSKGNKEILVELALYRLVSRFHKRKNDQEEIVVPIRYRLVSRFRNRRSSKRADVDKSS
jgi:parallel beta-helix repeat protein